MAYKRFTHKFMGQNAAEEALKALDGLGFQILTNTDYCFEHRPDGDEPRKCGCNVFWWVNDNFKTRYKQENAKVGDVFVDGNNGDRHEVVAVDQANKRLAVRNLSQNDDIIDIVGWW